LKLSRDFPGLLPSGLLDLSHVAREMDPVGCGPGKSLISLNNLAKAYLRCQLDKGDVRKSDWSKDLDADQQECQFVRGACFVTELVLTWTLSIAPSKTPPMTSTLPCSYTSVS
jgi:hypothetical protein